MKEIWKDVSGYEDYYQVSNLGRAKSKDRLVPNWPKGIRPIKGRILKCALNKRYFRVDLKKPDTKRKNALLHRLIAVEFIPNPNKKPYINHKDGNPSNNNINNLEWCTHKENMIHAYKTGLMVPLKNEKGEKCANSKLKNYQVLEIKQRILDGESDLNIAKNYSVTYGAINGIRKGKTWTPLELSLTHQICITRL